MQEQTQKIIKPIPALVLPEILANLMIARKACSDLVTRCDCTWDQTLESTMPDHVAIRVIDLKNSITLNVTEHVKFQTSFTFFVREKCNVDKPMKSQLLHMQKIKRCYL